MAIKSFLFVFFGFIGFFDILSGNGEESFSREKKLLLVNAGGAALIATWGFIHWDYGQKKAHAESEGWFEKDSNSGGADKLGHFYSNYTFTHILSSVYEDWGYSRREAALNGAISSFALMGFMEVGDAYSRYGFSHEDFLMNSLGSSLGYLIRRYPGLSEKIDFRVEYNPSFQENDFITDYENMKHLVAFKLNGFESFRETPLKYFELHLGYYTRGYSNRAEERGHGRERNVFFGITINISKFFKARGYRRTARFLNFYQPPFTTAFLKRDLND
jgi:hypothetical protein